MSPLIVVHSFALHCSKGLELMENQKSIRLFLHLKKIKRVSHEPLKPVCPVINTFFLFQKTVNSYYQTFHGALLFSHSSTNLFYRAMYPSDAKTSMLKSASSFYLLTELKRLFQNRLISTNVIENIRI